eukprot:TRINITY_DN60168_c0_g1_i1.p1 TRINITY_DN60168_c0_g1~~TRINITY_DN60168_c0_g1_i1.p1  ORF type:complete len:501 (+),score=108.14 TRINITY_DN60168_c0_g1_i1:102-1604(+)
MAAAGGIPSPRQNGMMRVPSALSNSQVGGRHREEPHQHGRPTWIARSWAPLVRRLGLSVGFAESAAFFCFGLTPWLAVNAVFVESTWLARRVPEGVRLASLLGAAAQVGNFAPLIYITLRQQKHVGERSTVIWQQLVAAPLSIAIGLTWWVSLWDVSWAILLLTVFTGAIGCTANITWQAYCNRFHLYGCSTGAEAQSMANAGLSASGLLPVVLGAAQIAGVGVGGGDARFGFCGYMAAIAAMQLSGLAGALAIEGPRDAFARICPALCSPSDPATFSPFTTSPSTPGEESALIEAQGLSLQNAHLRDSFAGLPVRSATSGWSRFWRSAREGHEHTHVLLPKVFSETANYAVLPGVIPFIGGRGGEFYLMMLYYCCNVAGYLAPPAVRSGCAQRTGRLVLMIAATEILCAAWLFWCAMDPSKAPALSARWALYCALPTAAIGALNATIAVSTFSAIGRLLPQGLDREAVNHAIGLTTQLGALMGTYATAMVVHVGVLTPG